jgi:hypothetical protein
VLLYLSTGRIPLALELTHKLLASVDLDATVKFRLCLALSLMGCESDSVERCLSSSPALSANRNAVVLALLKLERDPLVALEQLQKLLAVDDPVVKTLVAQRIARCMADGVGKYGDTELFGQILSTNRSDPQIVSSYILWLLRCNHFVEAERVLQSWTEDGAVPPIISVGAAWLYLRVGKWFESLVHSTNVLLSDFWNDSACYCYGVAMSELGDVDQAELSLRPLLDAKEFGHVAAMSLAKIFKRKRLYVKWIRLVLESGRRGWNSPELFVRRLQPNY